MNIPWEMLFDLIKELIATCTDSEAALLKAAREPTLVQRFRVHNKLQRAIIHDAPTRREGRRNWANWQDEIIGGVWSQAAQMTEAEAREIYADSIEFVASKGDDE